MNTFDFVAIGEILIDFTPAGKSESGETLFQQNMGGAPGNVACALAKLGWKCGFIGKAGNDGFGRFCARTLQELHVDASGLKLSDTENTTLAFVHLSDSGDRSFSFYRKNSADINMEIADVDMDIVKAARVFHFGGVSLTDDPSRETTFHAVAEAKKAGAMISFDPNLRMSLWRGPAEVKAVILRAFPYADVVKLSDEEVTFIFDTKDYYAAIRHIKERFGTKLVIVTRGPRGALTVAGGGQYTSPAYDVKTIDTTGAGDCFFAGALHTLLSQKKPPDALTSAEIARLLAFANAAGSLASTRMGAVSALPSAEEIERCVTHEKALIL
ncbi:MAG: carbohydrate kinase [Clostridiales bacterium]|jgi:sugar/nucleoside kinase (ribokinase family)|nr:carbohydrate kinase [Clostridiales bacterium]